METNAFLQWLHENWLRFGQKSPAFFKVWNVINGFIALIAAVPIALDILDISLTGKWLVVVSKIVAAAAGWGYLMGRFTVQRPPVHTTLSGDIINQTPAEKLPFTAQKEAEIINKKLNV